MTKTKAQQIMAATEVRAADDVTAAIQDIAAEFEPYIIKQRRHFHKHPELSLAEERTTSDIANQLDAMNIPYERPLKTGLVATLRGTAPDAYREDGTPRRRILLRADIDALPVTEQTGEEFASVNEGCMHACGHDGHMAVCAALCRVLGALSEEEKSKAKRNALVLFQSGEESAGGAQAVVDSGILAETRTDRIFALHLWPKLKKGKVYSTAGVCLAQNAEVDITISCPQSHAADNGADSLAEAARLLLSLEKEVSETGSAKSPCLLKFGRLTGCEICRTSGLAAEIRSIERALKGVSSCNERPSGARNVIGGGFKLEGTLRAVEPRAFCRAKEKINAAVCDSRDKGFAVFCEIREGSGAVCNCARLFALAQEAANVGSLPAPFLQAEDFSAYGKVCPSLYMFLGVGEVPPLHSPYFDFDESVLEKGLETFLRLFFS